MRRAAVEGMGRLRDRESLAAVKSLQAGDPSAAVRLAAAFAVGVMDEPQSHVLAGALASPDTSAQAGEYLLELGASAIPGVESALGVASDPGYRADLLHVLGFIGTRETAGLIEPYTKDPNERVTRAAANAIMRVTGTPGT
jgi:HEAT repeat protein